MWQKCRRWLAGRGKASFSRLNKLDRLSLWRHPDLSVRDGLSAGIGHDLGNWMWEVYWRYERSWLNIVMCPLNDKVGHATGGPTSTPEQESCSLAASFLHILLEDVLNCELHYAFPENNYFSWTGIDRTLFVSFFPSLEARAFEREQRGRKRKATHLVGTSDCYNAETMCAVKVNCQRVTVLFDRHGFIGIMFIRLFAAEAIAKMRLPLEAICICKSIYKQIGYNENSLNS